MSKAIKWQIPFASLSGTLYRLDIYAEGYTGDPIQLMAGDNPFTTDEDNSENFFTPVRSQTGNINVCTRKPDGTMLTLDEILPANNIDHPVRLINISNSNAIEWQGFLSCESYSQNYTAIPENLTLSVISVLEAMDSVFFKTKDFESFSYLMCYICLALNKINEECGLQLFNNIYISNYFLNALTWTNLYMNSLFSVEETVNGDNIFKEPQSVSSKKILEKIITLFGGCVREVGDDIYIDCIDKYWDYSYGNFQDVYEFFTDFYYPDDDPYDWDIITHSEAEIANMQWRGTNHKVSVSQGRKRVKVVSKLKGDSLSLAMPKCPVNSLIINPSSRRSVWGEVRGNTNEPFYNCATHINRLATVNVNVLSAPSRRVNIGEGSVVQGQCVQNTWPWISDTYLTDYDLLFGMDSQLAESVTVNHYLTAYMAFLGLKQENSNNTVMTSGLLVCGLPQYYNSQIVTNWWYGSEGDYIYKLSTPLTVLVKGGKIKISCEIGGYMTPDGFFASWEKTYTPAAFIAITYGQGVRYDHGQYKWGASQWLYLDKNGLEIELPITGMRNSHVNIYVSPIIYTGVTGNNTREVAQGIFITKLDVSYEAPANELLTDRSENTYLKEMDNGYKEDETIDSDIASDANNNKLSTLLYDEDGTTTIKLLSLGGNIVRPEEDLLDRMEKYYESSRRRLELEVEHPTYNNQPIALPLLKLNGINDGKVYLPLSESRDWREETCTITCFETAETPSES